MFCMPFNSKNVHDAITVLIMQSNPLQHNNVLNIPGDWSIFMNVRTQNVKKADTQGSFFLLLFKKFSNQ